EPAVLEQLVEDLGRSTAAAQLRRDRGDRRLEDLAQPERGGGGVGDRLLAGCFEPCAVARQVVQEHARLVLLRVEARQAEQAAAMVPGLDDLRVQEQADLVSRRDELDLFDVEAELVEPAQALLEPMAFAEREHLVASELVPEL